MNIFLFCVCDKQYSYPENIHFSFSFFSSYRNPYSTFLSAILASLIETRRSSIELCYSKKISSWLFNHRASCAREEKKKKKVGLFFPDIVVKWKCFLPGIGLFLSLSLSLLIIVCSFAHSLARFFRARQLRKMETFISILFYLLFLTYTDT